MNLLTKSMLVLALSALSLPAAADPLRGVAQLPTSYLSGAKKDAANSIADFLHEVQTRGGTSVPVAQSTIKPLETPRKK